jgi:anti-anti-sigma factor
MLKPIQHINILVIGSRLDASNHEELKSEYKQYINNGSNNFIVDLREATFIDSMGLATLTQLYKEVQANGGQILMVRPRHPSAIHILQITRFDQVFYMVDTVDLGMQVFRRLEEGRIQCANTPH